MEKKCENCKYWTLAWNKEPCVDCSLNRHPRFDNWESKDVLAGPLAEALVEVERLKAAREEQEREIYRLERRNRDLNENCLRLEVRVEEYKALRRYFDPMRDEILGVFWGPESMTTMERDRDACAEILRRERQRRGQL